MDRKASTPLPQPPSRKAFAMPSTNGRVNESRMNTRSQATTDPTTIKATPTKVAGTRKTARAISKPKTKATRKRSTKAHKPKVNNPKFADLPDEVEEVNPTADHILIGKLLLLEWPVKKGKIRWYSCRVVKFNENSREHTVVYEYGDDEFCVEDVNLNDGSRKWHVVKNDTATSVQDYSDGLENLIGRIVVVDFVIGETPEQRLKKTALILGINEGTRAAPRRSELFIPMHSIDRHFIVMWLYADSSIKASHNSYAREAYDMGQIRIAEHRYCTAVHYRSTSN